MGGISDRGPMGGGDPPEGLGAHGERTKYFPLIAGKIQYLVELWRKSLHKRGELDKKVRKSTEKREKEGKNNFICQKLRSFPKNAGQIKRKVLKTGKNGGNGRSRYYRELLKTLDFYVN